MRGRRRFTLLWLALLGSAASAHDRWANGGAVPGWVKAACCGQSDVHKIPPGAIRAKPDGYHIEDLHTIVPYERALPSPDGQFWGFWNPLNEPNPVIYCFFAPISGV